MMSKFPRPAAPVYGDPAEAHRNQYEADSMARAEAADTNMGPSRNLNMFSQAERTRHGNSLARSQAAYMPEWDRWFQAAGIGGNTSFGRGGDTGGFGQGGPAGYTPDQLDAENATALTGGAAPRWAQSQNLPSSEQKIAGSLQGLQRIMRGR
jgi:hypothetical protein